jgi:hypothetical protein
MRKYCAYGLCAPCIDEGRCAKEDSRRCDCDLDLMALMFPLGGGVAYGFVMSRRRRKRVFEFWSLLLPTCYTTSPESRSKKLGFRSNEVVWSSVGA